MKRITFIAALFLILASPKEVAGQSSEKALLTITVYESLVDDSFNKIVVFDNDKKIEEIPFPNLRKDSDSHQLQINKVLIKYRKQGYVLFSQLCGGFGGQSALVVMVTRFMLEK